MRANVRVHIRNKPSSCTLCSKSSSLLASLKLHTRMHTGEEPFSCLVCKKSFHWSSVLRKQSKINSEIKSYSCSRCSNYFISLQPPPLSGQYRPELGYRSIENFTVPHFQGQHRLLRGGVGSRFQWPLTGNTGALGKWVGNVKHQRILLFYDSRKLDYS